MARYTDIDKLIAEYDRVHIGPAGGARKLMVEAPIADVVPREEVDNLKVEFEAMRSAAHSYKMHYQNIAKEIFGEIEKALNLSKCYGDSGIYFESDIETDINELKKKYTEENKYE